MYSKFFTDPLGYNDLNYLEQKAQGVIFNDNEALAATNRLRKRQIVLILMCIILPTITDVPMKAKTNIHCKPAWLKGLAPTGQFYFGGYIIAYLWQYCW